MLLIERFEEQKINLMTIVILMMAGYFFYHAFFGNLGYVSLKSLYNEYHVLANKYDEIKAEKMILEHKVNHMQAASLDIDLSEQQIRDVLGFADPREQIIIIKKDD
ncbi:FtsB family cell division protein [Rickettsiales endosymbiont of Stachyamoeba lipophora]|uniref:FtsB family cell division protein n=1 Tax=Rickettsiales endosymbiont of Stachyamoeba lipophora TaxID=2486578 RepID=UPI000F649FA0|nr:septum formation initiator family protein [Rickettsiales endosymbiont of Stachyamoeba lipophora]AZL16220.1 hypothetical protein EF513_06730 [Rickettsiales endosymbiont of Stachyamoeba lipophora]